MRPIVVKLPLRLVNETNAREHWAARSSRAKAQRGITSLRLSAELRANPWRPPGDRWRISITRLGPRRLDDDNLAASAKHVRDGVADALGIDDGDERLAWEYHQRRGDFGVEIALTGRDNKVEFLLRE
jgi:crossover junction endodeoxyribonuclease RusA